MAVGAISLAFSMPQSYAPPQRFGSICIPFHPVSVIVRLKQMVQAGI
jgi:hypothetical protein